MLTGLNPSESDGNGQKQMNQHAMTLNTSSVRSYSPKDHFKHETRTFQNQLAAILVQKVAILHIKLMSAKVTTSYFHLQKNSNMIQQKPFNKSKDFAKKLQL